MLLYFCLTLGNTQCCDDLRDHPSFPNGDIAVGVLEGTPQQQCYSMGGQQGWGHTGPQQRVWGALQGVSSLSAMLAWPAEHLQELQPTLQL